MRRSWLDNPITQDDFADLIGVTQQAVSEMIVAGHLSRKGTGRDWLLAYCKRLRDKAAGRDNDSILSQERAALARAQRIGQEMKNAIVSKDYAPISLMATVLAEAAQSAVEHFDALPASLRVACPDLPYAAREELDRALADARNRMAAAVVEFTAARLAKIAEKSQVAAEAGDA
ncbi:MAG: hypothetical protein JNN18_09490 [Rubrivivax sp.]|nr:hypothetical protein [Rubrivivax sp.]